MILLLLLLRVALIPASHGKCFGTQCEAMESEAKAHGLLGASMPACKARDRTFNFNAKWQTTLESELQALAWSGEDDQWVWAITTGTTGMMVSSARHVYWSQDHGETMVDRFPTMAKMVNERMGADSDRLASVNQVLVNKDDPKKVLLWGDGNLSFMSTDGGNTLKLVDVPAGTLGLSHTIRQHPTRADWLLSIAYREICYISGTFGCAMDLWLSNDFGISWKNLTEASGGKLAGFLDCDWGYHDGQEKYTKLFQETTILATAHVGHYQTIRDILQDDTDLYRSDDNFVTSTKLASCGSAFALVAGQVFFVHPDVCDDDIHGRPAPKKSITTRRDALTLYVSRDGSDFAEVCMPTQLSDSAYTMVSTQDGRGNFMIADHHNKEAAVSNMYANGNIAELYTLSIRNIHFGFRRGSKPDIKSLRPIYSRYIVNVLESPLGANQPLNDRTFDAVTTTKITHNSGASWKLIAMDPSDVRHPVCKQSCQAGQPCYLHLHGASSWVRGSLERPSVYAAKSAPGIVMASGNLGPEKQGLSTDKEMLCTWLSRDGGMTWVDVVDDLYIYEYLNHGNIIAMAKFREEGPAEYLHVSLDQGQCFYKIRITPEGNNDTQLFVNNILVEPDGAATIAHVTGSQHIASLNKRQDVIITIDIRDVLSGPDISGNTVPPRAECDDSDFEDWTSGDETGEPLCILGSTHSFYRMKATQSDQGCFLKKDYVFKPAETKPCDCKAEDFYCEYGYEKTTFNSQCDEMADSVPVCQAIEVEAYQRSESHMRLAHGEVCPNLNRFIEDTDGNGNMAKHEWNQAHFDRHATGQAKRRGGHGLLWFFGVLVVCLGGFAAFKYGPPAVQDAGASMFEGGVGLAVWVIDGFKGLVNKARGQDPEELGFERLGDSNQDSLYAVP